MCVCVHVVGRQLLMRKIKRPEFLAKTYSQIVFWAVLEALLIKRHPDMHEILIILVFFIVDTNIGKLLHQPPPTPT